MVGIWSGGDVGCGRGWEDKMRLRKINDERV